MDEGTTTDTSINQPSNGTAAPWHASITPALQDAPDISNWLQSRPEKDAASFVKSHYNLEKKLGTSLVPPGKNAKPEEITAFRHKVLGGPGSPDKYDFKKLTEMLGDDNVDQEILGEYRNVLHEYGLPQSAIDKLADLRGKEYAKAKALIEHDSEAEKSKFADWARTQGLDSHQAETMAAEMMLKRAAAAGADKEQVKAILNITGLGDAAWLMQAFAELGMATGEGSSQMDGQPTAGATAQGAAAEQEYNDILHNKQNPKYEMFWKGDKATIDYVHALGRRAHPGETQL